MNQTSTDWTMESLDALLDAAVDAIVIIDEQGLMLRFNRAAETMFGYSENEALGQNVSILMPDPNRSRHDKFLRNYRKTGRGAIIGIGREVIASHKNGTQFHIHLSVGEIHTSDSPRYVGIIRDLSEHKRIEDDLHELEQQLMHADRLVTLGELTAGIAHEINQPLTAIAAFADAGEHLLVMHMTPRNPEMEIICRRISEQARRAGKVVERLRTLSRRGAMPKAFSDLRLNIRNVMLVTEYRIKNTGINFTVNLPDELPEVYMDEIQIQQVLVNLINNAIDVLASTFHPSPEIFLSVTPSEGELLITVEDNGPGIDKEVQPRLFEPFFTTKANGVGLGLSICQNIARAHGSELRYEEPAGGGARFKLGLPLNSIG
jgi:two-component system sensor kinase FixL